MPQYRFAFDMGESSLGWAVFRLEHGRAVELVKTGVRLFSEARTPKGELVSAQAAAERRLARGARRNRDRTLRRKKRLLSQLEAAGLLPPPGPERDRLVTDISPYDIRSRAASEQVSLHEFGRALWHLSQRRGFKSNRKADTKPDEKGKIAGGKARLETLLEEGGYKTVGQFLAERQAAEKPEDRKTVRIRLTEKEYEFYPQRAMVEAEFEHIWNKQTQHHPELTETLRNQLRETIFHQRNLKPVPAGRCTFFPKEDRLPRWDELAQEFLIYTKLGHLRVTINHEERRLTLDEQQRMAKHVLEGAGLKKSDANGLKWNKVRALLSLPKDAEFNLEQGGEKTLDVSPLPFRLDEKDAKKKSPGPFPEGFFTLPPETRRTILCKLNDAVSEEDEAGIAHWAMAELNLSAGAAERLSRITLPDGHIRLGRTAASKIVKELKAGQIGEDDQQVTINYNDAARRAGFNHSDLNDGEYFDHLPPYNRIEALQRHLGFGTGDPDDPPDIRYGRIANPTVHIGLNQLRRVMNALVDLYGKPEEIVLELARELNQSQRKKDEAAKRNKANREANDSRREDLEGGGHIETGQRRIRDKLMRMRLWEELGENPLDRKCPYTSKAICLARLMSDEVEIEHILPFSKTLDNSIANKTVALLKANRLKRNLSPAEAADRHPDVFDKAGMWARTRYMPANKRWRFEDDAMATFAEQKSFTERQLNATQYLARLARDYVSKLYPSADDEGRQRNHVWVVTGKLTSLLRHRWGLNLGDHNRKSRDDHRHHAIDACVIGVIDRSLIQKISTIAAHEEEAGVDRLLANLEEPYEGYCDEVHSAIQGLLVNVRASHGQTSPEDPSKTSGKLHEETSYGLVKDISENADDLEIGNVVRRKQVSDLTHKDIDQIRDLKIREALQAVRDKAGGDKKALTAALSDWSKATRIHRVRVLKAESGVVPIKDRKTGKPYKYVIPAENAYMDIIETTEGDWKGVAIDSYAANTGQGDDWQTLYPAGKFIMRVHKGDTLQLFDEDGENRVKRVYRIGVKANILYLANINEAGELQKRHDDKDDHFRWDFANIGKLKERRARRVRFTPAGRMKTVPHGKV